jgi:hypothetical protein
MVAILWFMSAERLGVQLQARRQVVVTILHRCRCGGIDSCNAMFDGVKNGKSDVGYGARFWCRWRKAPTKAPTALALWPGAIHHRS